LDAALARTITAVEFAEFLKHFHLSRPSFDERDFDSSINSELTLALRSNSYFVIRDQSAPSGDRYHIETAYVQPRAAALWLLSKPSERWLVPEELRAFLEDQVKPQAATLEVEGGPTVATKHGGGAPEKYDWEAVLMALKEGCEHYGGVPRLNHPDLVWRRPANACRYVRQRMAKEWADGGPVDSTLKDRVGSFLKQIADKSAEN
jgi:hypothetical protein